MVQRPKTSFKKERNATLPILNENTIMPSEQRKTTVVKKNKSPDKIGNKQKDTKSKSSNIKKTKTLKSASLIKKTDDTSKIPVSLSKSSTYNHVTVQKHKMKTVQKKKTLLDASKPDRDLTSIPPSERYIFMHPENNIQRIQKLNNKETDSRIKKMKKRDLDNTKRRKSQYLTSVLADMHKSDLESTLRRYSTETDKPKPLNIKKTKRKSIVKKNSPKLERITPRIVSENIENESDSISTMLKETPSLKTHFLEADSQTSKIPIAKKHLKVLKPKKTARARINVDGKDAKSTQLTQHKKKSKVNTLKLNRVKSSDSVPNLPIREIKHNDSFVLSAKKLENSSMQRAARHLKSPEHLKLKSKRLVSVVRSGLKKDVRKADISKPEQLKSCLKKNWDENEFTAVNTKYQMNFGRVPLIVN